MVVTIKICISYIRNWWNIDALGYLRGKYKNPLFALRIGHSAVRNGLRDQLLATRQEGIENIGKNLSVDANERRDAMFTERDWYSIRHG